MKHNTFFLNQTAPISLRPYRTAPLQEKEISNHIQTLLAAGLIRERNRPYSAPFTLVMKRDDGEFSRLCIDYRNLNIIIKNYYDETLSRIDGILDKLASDQYFFNLDLASGYWHIRIHPLNTEK